MRATLLLCDAAQVDLAQKLHLIGGAWSITKSPLPSHAVAIVVHVEWSETNRQHRTRLELQTADGETVGVEGPDGTPHPLVNENIVEVGRPPGVPEGISFDAPMTVTIGPGLPLPHGRYNWRLTINGEARDEWVVPFLVQE